MVTCKHKFILAGESYLQLIKALSGFQEE